MRLYLISDEQIQLLYDAHTLLKVGSSFGLAGSRDFERVIQAVKTQEVTVDGAAELLRLKK